MRRTPTFAPLLALTLAACVHADDDTCVTERALSQNRIALNRIALNGVVGNGLLGAGLTAERLTGEAVAAAIGDAGLGDPEVQSVLEYAVSCALAPGQSLTVGHGDDTLVYEGALGLAPQWAQAGGTCDAHCQGWVSACLIARSNFLGQSRPISLRGDHPGLATGADELASFPIDEATYFGELFGDDKTMYACLPAGASGPTRTCGDDPSQCAITVVGACDEACDAAGCRGADGRRYAERITVHLSEAAACEASP